MIDKYMRLSKLQKFILIKCYNSRSSKVDRNVFISFYRGQSKAKAELRTKIITGSLESLINRDLMVGYGLRTSQKWFIRDVGLTDKGKKMVRDLFGKQLKLKFKK